MFGEDTIPDPIDFIYPRWSSTPWAYRTYSNWPPGLTLEGHQNLRGNVGRVGPRKKPTVEIYGYLHGAYLEGKVIGEKVCEGAM